MITFLLILIAITLIILASKENQGWAIILTFILLFAILVWMFPDPMLVILILLMKELDNIFKLGPIIVAWFFGLLFAYAVSVAVFRYVRNKYTNQEAQND